MSDGRRKGWVVVWILVAFVFVAFLLYIQKVVTEDWSMGFYATIMAATAITISLTSWWSIRRFGVLPQTQSRDQNAMSISPRVRTIILPGLVTIIWLSMISILAYFAQIYASESLFYISIGTLVFSVASYLNLKGFLAHIPDRQRILPFLVGIAVLSLVMALIKLIRR